MKHGKKYCRDILKMVGGLAAILSSLNYTFKFEHIDSYVLRLVSCLIKSVSEVVIFSFGILSTANVC